MAFLFDQSQGYVEREDFDVHEQEEGKRENEILSDYNHYIKSRSNYLIQKRTDEEWAYALFFDYKYSKMNEDFIGIVSSLCNFYLDPKYSQDLQTSTQDRKSTAKNNNQTMNSDSHSQTFIVSTANILIGLDEIPEISTNSAYKKATVDNLYQIFILLVILGKETSVQKEIRSFQESEEFGNAADKQIAMERLELLIKFCSENVNNLVKTPYNVCNSPTIIRQFVFSAMMAYEKFAPPHRLKTGS